MRRFYAATTLCCHRYRWYRRNLDGFAIRKDRPQFEMTLQCLDILPQCGFERDLIRERTQAGLAAVRARGRMGGRPKKLDSAAKVAMARSLYNDTTNTVTNICKTLRGSRATLYRSLDVPATPDTQSADH